MTNDIALVGSWSLQSWTIDYSDGRPRTFPYGENPQGLIMYSADGWMSAAINRDQRPLMDQAVGLRQQPERVLADAYKSYFHYAGRYRLEGNTVIHSVVQSLNPNFVGSEQVRHISFENNFLILTGYEEINTVTRTHRLTWQANGEMN